MRKAIRQFLEQPIVDYFLISLILLNFACYIIQTDAHIADACGEAIRGFEFISVLIFTIELILRMVCVERWRNIFHPMMIVDFLAVVPYYLTFVSVNTVILRILRLSRLLRAAKLIRYTTALQRIARAFYRRKDEIIVTGLIFTIAVILISISIYYAENGTSDPTFSSVPNSFWWTVITCTSVGYGDAYPITVAGKIIGALAAILGVGLHALLIGVIGAAFGEVIREERKRNKEKMQSQAEKDSLIQP